MQSPSGITEHQGIMNRSVFFGAAIFLSLLATSCSSDNTRAKKSSELIDSARTLIDSHRYSQALELLDTLDIKYRDCLEQRKEGTTVRLTAMAAMTRDSLASAELQLRRVERQIDSLSPLFIKIDIAGTNGYFVDKNVYSAGEMNVNTVQARIDEDGYCSLIANVYNRRIGLRSIEYGNVSTAPTRSIDVENSELMSVTQESALPLLQALTDAKGAVKLVLIGSKGKVDLNLTAKQTQGIVDTWSYAQALQHKRALAIRLEKLERQLAKLSDQIASQIPVDESAQ